MRIATYRGLAFGSAFLLCAATLAAQPPISSSDKLKADTAALAGERAAAESSSNERAKLQADLRRLLERIDKIPSPGTGPMSPPTTPGTTPKVKDDGSSGGAIDQLRAATNLVRNNQFEDALTAFRLVPLDKLTPDDRAFVRYMTAACLRRLGRTAEAVPIYREVSDAGDEPFIASSAVSQLALIRNADELQVQLAQLRSRPKSK